MYRLSEYCTCTHLTVDILYFFLNPLFHNKNISKNFVLIFYFHCNKLLQFGGLETGWSNALSAGSWGLALPGLSSLWELHSLHPVHCWPVFHLQSAECSPFQSLSVMSSVFILLLPFNNHVFLCPSLDEGYFPCCPVRCHIHRLWEFPLWTFLQWREKGTTEPTARFISAYFLVISQTAQMREMTLTELQKPVCAALVRWVGKFECNTGWIV